MNRLKKALDDRGMTPLEAHKLGVPYHNIVKQYHGIRRVTAECAVRYEAVLGIPRWELRPDLWDKPCDA